MILSSYQKPHVRVPNGEQEEQVQERIGALSWNPTTQTYADVLGRADPWLPWPADRSVGVKELSEGRKYCFMLPEEDMMCYVLL